MAHPLERLRWQMPSPKPPLVGSSRGTRRSDGCRPHEAPSRSGGNLDRDYPLEPTSQARSRTVVLPCHPSRVCDTRSGKGHHDAGQRIPRRISSACVAYTAWIGSVSIGPQHGRGSPVTGLNRSKPWLRPPWISAAPSPRSLNSCPSRRPWSCAVCPPPAPGRSARAGAPSAGKHHPSHDASFERTREPWSRASVHPADPPARAAARREPLPPNDAIGSWASVGMFAIEHK